MANIKRPCKRTRVSSSRKGYSTVASQGHYTRPLQKAHCIESRDIESCMDGILMSIPKNAYVAKLAPFKFIGNQNQCSKGWDIANLRSPLGPLEPPLRYHYSSGARSRSQPVLVHFSRVGNLQSISSTRFIVNEIISTPYFFSRYMLSKLDIKSERGV